MTPTNKRCDGYIASPDPIEKGRVLFIGTHRAVVVKEFKTFEEFQKERFDPRWSR